MRFKLDENLGARWQQLFHVRGHEARTVRDQRLQGCSDGDLYEACRAERLCLVTLDLDFADVTRFSPGDTGGIVVLRLPRDSTPALMERLVLQLLGNLSRTSVEGHLWVVELGRIRVHESEADA